LSKRLYIEKNIPEDEDDINNVFKSLTAPEQMVLFKKFRHLEREIMRKEIIEKEKEIIEKEKEIITKEKEKEIIVLTKDLEIFRERMGRTELDYLRIKGSVHVRGVLESQTFQKFWKHRQNQTIPIDVNFVAGEMQTLYKWMSERIHNVNARGGVVEWSKSNLGNEWSQVVEYMCKDLNIKYEVFGNENENAP
ncbi:11175_t:CDS:2, partial [Entrophospora sp. SA101]